VFWRKRDKDSRAVPLSDDVSTFRGEGDGPDVVALSVADDVSTFRGERVSRSDREIGARPLSDDVFDVSLGWGWTAISSPLQRRATFQRFAATGSERDGGARPRDEGFSVWRRSTSMEREHRRLLKGSCPGERDPVREVG